MKASDQRRITSTVRPFPSNQSQAYRIPDRRGWRPRPQTASGSHMRARAALVVSALVAMTCTNLVAPPKSISGAPPASPAPAQPPSVILISVDTLRADHLGCFGYHGVATPNIDELARSGTIFTAIDSQVPATLPSHASIFTSSYPFATGIEENGETVPPGAVTLTAVLKDHGYHTAAFIGGYFLARRFGLDQGFDLYDSPFDSRPLRRALDLKRPADSVVAGAARWLEFGARDPFFVFVHLFDLHQPYAPPAAFAARAGRSGYDSELAYVDSVLGDFFAFLHRKGLDRRTLVVLISDHGESLGDHGEHTHGYFVYQSTLHVPVIIHWPDAANVSDAIPKPMPARISQPAGLIDVAPTILQAVGIAPPPPFAGHSLLELARPGAAPREVLSESVYARDKFGWAALCSLRTGKWQYIDAPKPELYDVDSDPGEVHNLAGAQAALALSYRDRIRSVEAHQKTAPGPTISPAVLESLRSLGYLAVASRRAQLASGPDPKDRLPEYLHYLKALELAQTGSAPRAATLFQSIVAGDPGNVAALAELARCDAALHRYPQAEENAHKVLSAVPDDLDARELLGSALVAEGREEAATREFQQILKLSPGDFGAESELASIAARHQRFDEAVTHYRAAVAAEPSSAETHYRLGLALESLGRRSEAATEYRAAVRYDPSLTGAVTALDRLESN